MKIARAANADGDRFWALIDVAAGLARRIDAPFAAWAPLAAAGDETALDLAPEPMPLAGLQLLAPLEPGARVFGVGHT